MSGENDNLNIEEISLENIAADENVDGGGDDYTDGIENFGDDGDEGGQEGGDEDTNKNNGGEGGAGADDENPDDAPAGGDDGEEEDEDDEEEISLEDATVDEEGNLVGADGKVIYKKGEYKLIQNEDGSQEIEVDDRTGLNQMRDIIKEEYGIELAKDGNPIEYDNTPEGLAKMVKDGAAFLAAKNEQKLFGQYPLAKQFLSHLMAGQNPKSFFDVTTNYRDITIPEETAENKAKLQGLYKNLIVAQFREQYNYNALTKEEQNAIDKQAEDFYEFKKNGGTERDAAASAQKLLAGIEKQREDARNAENQKILDAQKAADDAYWGGVKQLVVEDGQVDNIKIPEDIREGFFEWMSADADGQGNTQEYLDAMKDDEETRNMNLKLALLRYTNFDLNKLIKMQMAEEKAKEIKLLAGKKRIKVGKGLKITKTTNDTSGITVDKLFGNDK